MILVLAGLALLVCVQVLAVGYELTDGTRSVEGPAMMRAVSALGEFGRAAVPDSMGFVTAMLGLVIALHAGAAFRADRASAGSHAVGEHRAFALLASTTAVATGLWLLLLLVGGVGDETVAPPVAASMLLGGVTIVLASLVGRLFVPPLETQISVAEIERREVSDRLQRIGEPDRSGWAILGARCALLGWVVAPPIAMICAVTLVGRSEGYSVVSTASLLTALSVILSTILMGGWISWAATTGIVSSAKRAVSLAAQAVGILILVALAVLFALDQDPVSRTVAAGLIGWAVVAALAFWLPSVDVAGLDRWSAARMLDISVAADQRRRLRRLDDRVEKLRGERRLRRTARSGRSRITGASRARTSDRGLVHGKPGRPRR